MAGEKSDLQDHQVPEEVGSVPLCRGQDNQESFRCVGEADWPDLHGGQRAGEGSHRDQVGGWRVLSSLTSTVKV